MPVPDADAVFERIERLMRSQNLPEVERSTSYRTPALKVSNTTFARLKDASTLVLHCPEEQKVMLLDISPEIYQETPHYEGQPLLLINLDAISDEELALRLHDAWHFRAPERLRRSAKP